MLFYRFDIIWIVHINCAETFSSQLRGCAYWLRLPILLVSYPETKEARKVSKPAGLLVPGKELLPQLELSARVHCLEHRPRFFNIE